MTKFTFAPQVLSKYPTVVAAVTRYKSTCGPNGVSDADAENAVFAALWLLGAGKRQIYLDILKSLGQDLGAYLMICDDECGYGSVLSAD